MAWVGSSLTDRWAASMRYRDFRLLWVASTIQSVGFGMERVALGWLVFEMTDSEFMVGVSSAVAMAPFFFLGILSGAIADWADRRVLIRFATLGGVVAAGLIPSLGVHHRHRNNPFCLADDLLEPYRPYVDWRVRLMVGEGGERTLRRQPAALRVEQVPEAVHPVVGVLLFARTLLADVGGEWAGLRALGVVAVRGNALAGRYGADATDVELDGQALALRVANQAIAGAGDAEAAGEVEAVMHR